MREPDHAPLIFHGRSADLSRQRAGLVRLIRGHVTHAGRAASLVKRRREAMNPHSEDTSTIGDLLFSAAHALAALGILTMALFPFAIPGILLAVALAVPLLVGAAVVGLVSAVVGGLFAAVAPVSGRAVRALRGRGAYRRDARFA
jgi:hypothetical protein